MQLTVTTDRDISIEVETPRGPLGRMKGLLGRELLAPEKGMLLTGKQVHTFGMRFAIDALYLDGDHRVLSVERLAPRRLGPFRGKARWVLELADGEAARLGIVPGMTLKVVEELA